MLRTISSRLHNVWKCCIGFFESFVPKLLCCKHLNKQKIESFNSTNDLEIGHLTIISNKSWMMSYNFCSTGMAISILVVLPSIDRKFSQGFCVRDLYVFDSSYLNSGVVPSISSSFQSRQFMRGLVAVVSQTKLHEGWTILKSLWVLFAKYDLSLMMQMQFVWLIRDDSYPDMGK